MRDQPHFRNGQTILLREIWNNQVWSARPEIVVQDKPELMAFYMPGGTMWKQPRTVNDSRVNAQSRSQSEWVLKVAEWLGSGRLRMTIPGKHYSVLIFWNAEDGMQQWYINLEDQLRRTTLGFDYIYQLLDIVVTPELTSWNWKDDDELEQAVSL